MRVAATGVKQKLMLPASLFSEADSSSILTLFRVFDREKKILLNKRMWYKKPGTPLTFGPSKCSNVKWEAHKRVFQSLQTRGHLLGGENTQVNSTAL